MISRDKYHQSLADILKPIDIWPINLFSNQLLLTHDRNLLRFWNVRVQWNQLKICNCNTFKHQRDHNENCRFWCNYALGFPMNYVFVGGKKKSIEIWKMVLPTPLTNQVQYLNIHFTIIPSFSTFWSWSLYTRPNFDSPWIPINFEVDFGI